jgi:hypothetical protein
LEKLFVHGVVPCSWGFQITQIGCSHFEDRKSAYMSYSNRSDLSAAMSQIDRAFKNSLARVGKELNICQDDVAYS